MSLLLEALKKAEKAKEEAQRRASSRGEPGAELNLVDDSAGAEGKRVRTRDELPDISQPMEILSDDLGRGRPPRSGPELALEPEAPTPPPAPAAAPRAPRREPRASSTAAPAAQRATAQKVFEAKFKEPNPRLPFILTLVALGVFGIGTGVYFWIQLRPAPSLVNLNPPRPAGEKPVDVASAPSPAAPAAPAAPAPAAPAAAPAATAAGPAPASAAPSAPAEAPKAAAPIVKAEAQKAAPKSDLVRPQRGRPAPPAQADSSSVTVNRGGAQLDPRLSAAYAAVQSGDFATAQSGYEQVLRDDPRNRDALLGLAAIEMRARRYDAAESYYQRLLQADPRDPYANAGMLALRGASVDALAAESRVKTMLASDPDASVLYFSLGNQYARQGRWPEAQQAYFKAYSAEPDNPDFAYNLAVSLEHLRQSRPALDYYRRALALAEKRGAGFDAAAARERVRLLSR